MPRDKDYGVELAAQLTELYSGMIGTVEFTYDPFLELDQLADDQPYCKVSPNNYIQVRESRYDWREEISLELTLISRVSPSNIDSWTGQWLDSWDMLIRNTRDLRLFGRHPPMDIDIGERFDSNMFHNNRRLLTQATLRYVNVEVK